MEEIEVKEESGLSLLDIWKIFIKNIWIILACTVVCGVAGGVYGMVLKTPTYRSDTTVIMDIGYTGDPDSDKTSSTELNNATVATLRLMETASQLMQEPAIAKRVSNKVYGTENNYKSIVKGLTVTASTTSLIINLSYESTDKENVKEILKQVIIQTKEFCKEQGTGLSYLADRIVGGEDEWVSDPVYASPNKKLLLALGLVAGFVIGFVVAIVREVCSDRITNKKMVEEKLGIRVIGLIPDFENKQGGKKNETRAEKK